MPTLEIWLSKEELTGLRKLARSGLFGPDAASAAERLIASGLQEAAAAAVQRNAAHALREDVLRARKQKR